MRTIVHQNYPVADLPEDLREGLPTDAHVRIVIEPEISRPERVPTLDEIFALRRPPYKTKDEIVEELRRDRDERDA